MTNQNLLKVENLAVKYLGELGSSRNVLTNINFSIRQGKFHTIIAPAGAGKSTLLRCIAGVHTSCSGEVYLKDIERVEPGTEIVLIPEPSSSFPWLSVREDIGWVLKHNKVPKDQIGEKCLSIIKLVGLEGYEDHIPNQNSLGFRFRIALARALAVSSALILLDEPFKRMDELTRSEIISLIKELKTNIGSVIILATANLNEALELSDFVYLMSKDPAVIFKTLEVHTGDIQKIRTEIEESFRSIGSPGTINITV